MGSLIPSELSLACRLKSSVRKTIEGFLADYPTKVLKPDDFLYGLRGEKKKIEAFKRELPLCMILLDEAIATASEKLSQCDAAEQPVLEEFIPLKKICTDEKEEEEDRVEGNKENEISSRDKMNWMSSVQLWNSDNHYPKSDLMISHKPVFKLDDIKVRKEEETNRAVMGNLFQSGKKKTVERAFVPLKGCDSFPVMMMGKEDKVDNSPVPGLSLCIPEIKNSMEGINSIGFSSKSSSSRSGSSSAIVVQSHSKAGQQQATRKQRRCWSPELHRQFVNALQQLGGAQVATPKQIRELMQIDGLTIDEVKSHLQKYRLHTRRVTASSTTQPIDLWTSKEQYGEYSKQSESGSPEGPLHSDRGNSGDDSMEDEDEDGE